MSGTRTRFGFAGSEGDLPVRGAPTLLGHGQHQEPAPAEPRPEAPAEPIAPELPIHSGKSGLPAVAQDFGRWSSEGELRAHTPRPPAGPDRDLAPTQELTASDGYGDELELPRERLGRPMIVVVAVAAFCFVVAGLITRLGGRREPAASVPAAAPEPPVRPEPLLRPEPLVPVPSSTAVSPAPTGDSPRPTPPPRVTDDSPPPATRAPAPRRSKVHPARVADPDNVLPPRFLR